MDKIKKCNLHNINKEVTLFDPSNFVSLIVGQHQKNALIRTQLTKDKSSGEVTISLSADPEKNHPDEAISLKVIGQIKQELDKLEVAYRTFARHNHAKKTDQIDTLIITIGK